jgi:hypothetical protein
MTTKTPKRREAKKWSIPLILDDEHVDSECIPNRVIRSNMFHCWQKLPTVSHDIEYRLGKSKRVMWEAKFKNQPALVDTVTGQLYVNGKCQSGDARIC